MAYGADVVRRARRQLENAKADKESVYQQHLREAYQKEPRLKEIDLMLRKSMALAAQAVFTAGTDARQAMEQVKEANLALQQERSRIIEKAFPEGYLDDSPICPHCGGSGYVGASMCRCLALLCRREQKKDLALLGTGEESFRNFRLDYYPDTVDPRYNTSPRRIMERVAGVCRSYAETFDGSGSNLLFIGGTGLGKTYLSACIADVVTDRGYSICYESAPELFSKLERNRFSPDEETKNAAARFAGCDLLIIDDLGTELPGNFVSAALYSLLNQRLLEKKSTVISTNLTVEELSRRYSPQIASRLQGSFKRLSFVGEDIRILKNRGV